MKKSPEEYFKEQDFSVGAVDKSNFSPAEQAFMDKYLGVESGAVLEKLGIDPSGEDRAAPDALPDQHPEMMREESLDNLLRNSPDLLMVGFFIGSQEFVIPTMTVQEVIRTMPMAKLPAAPEQVAGVINLRGKVTPLILLRDVLEVASGREHEDKFIIVCRRRGIQIGLIIERVHTMYRVEQKDLDWSIETHIGANADFVSGLMKQGDKLLGIVSVDKVIESILN